jgi:hypothetical protein
MTEPLPLEYNIFVLRISENIFEYYFCALNLKVYNFPYTRLGQYDNGFNFIRFRSDPYTNVEFRITHSYASLYLKEQNVKSA